MAESGKNGGVYSDTLLIEDCEVNWTSNGSTSSDVDADHKVGTYSIKHVIPGGLGANQLLGHKASINLTTMVGYDGMYLWMKDSVGSSLNDNQMLLASTSDCTNPLEELQIPALTSGTWTQIFLPFDDPSLLGSIDSVGLKQIAALGARNIFHDDIRALALEDGIKSWTLEYSRTMLNKTDFSDVGISAFIPGISEWHGTFEGLKSSAPMSVAGAEVYIVLGETSTGSQCWIGKAILSNARPSTDHDGLVTYGYDFQGTGALQPPTT